MMVRRLVSCYCVMVWVAGILLPRDLQVEENSDFVVLAFTYSHDRYLVNRCIPFDFLRQALETTPVIAVVNSTFELLF